MVPGSAADSKFRAKQGEYESYIQAVGDLFSSILHNNKKVTSGQHKTCTTVKMVVKYQANLM